VKCKTMSIFQALFLTWGKGRAGERANAGRFGHNHGQAASGACNGKAGGRK
jgi:hypothetical protein